MSDKMRLPHYETNGCACAAVVRPRYQGGCLKGSHAIQTQPSNLHTTTKHSTMECKLHCSFHSCEENINS